jgi:hypothetical protein
MKPLFPKGPPGSEFAREKDLASELAGIENLLLRPGPSAMREVELRLTSLIAFVKESGVTEFETRVKSSVRNVRFLLDRAKQFWDRRRVDLVPGVQYCAGGALVENASEPSFALEV